MPEAVSGAAARIRKAAHLLKGDAGDYDPLIRAVRDSRYILLGEASHGDRPVEPRSAL